MTTITAIRRSSGYQNIVCRLIGHEDVFGAVGSVLPTQSCRRCGEPTQH